MGNKQATKPENKQPEEPKQQLVQFKLHIAIDFGTHGCALAFAYKDKANKDKVTIYNKWRLQQTNTRSRIRFTKKTRTQLILNEDDEVTCFGNAAQYTYFNLTQRERERKQFFDRFKMALYEEHLSRSNDIIKSDDDEKRDAINTSQYLYASNGKRIESKIVFIAAFKELQDIAKNYIVQLKNIDIDGDEIDDDYIQWILTVPAIWSDKAKNNMRDWMIEAGLVKKHIMNQCMIVYEPDCASISMQKQYFRDLKKKSKYEAEQESIPNIIFNPCDDDLDEDKEDSITEDVEHFTSYKNKQNSIFEKDDKYILIDAGGGTVDIACHKILDNGCVEEIVYPTGDKWGSCYIDDLFETLLKEIFSAEWIDLYKKKEPSGFLELFVNFQNAKETFYRNFRQKTHRVQLPIDFCFFLCQQCEKENIGINGKINQFGQNKEIKYFKKLFSNKDDEKDDDDDWNESVCSLKYVREEVKDDADIDKKEEEDEDDSESDEDDTVYIEFIEMSVSIWKCLFDSKINPIISHVEKLLEVEDLTDCKFLALVGGFSCSKYFQYRIQKKFGIDGYYQMAIVIPKEPMLSVVEGAALMATTGFKYIRARKLKYTYGIGRVCTVQAAKDRGIADDYINNKDNISTDGYVKGIFDIVASQNERVSINDVKSTIGHRRGKSTLVPIFKSNKSEPKLQSEGEMLATLHVHYTDSKTETVTEFHFGGTIFRVYSYPKSNRNAKQEVDIKYTQ